MNTEVQGAPAGLHKVPTHELQRRGRLLCRLPTAELDLEYEAIVEEIYLRTHTDMGTETQTVVEPNVGKFNISPDWTKVWTAAEAEHNLENFFFKGPGWYITETTTMLVVSHGRTLDVLWNSKWNGGEYFTFMYYGGRNPGDSFSAVVNAPVREDRR